MGGGWKFIDKEHNAAADGCPPGTVSHLQPRFACDYPPTLTAHDIGLKDLIESAAFLGDAPRVDLITISVGAIDGLSIELSPAVAAALPHVEALVARVLAAHPEDADTQARCAIE